ncbi:MAG: VacJ family lipoprotein [Pseudomonadales bacterium]|nr:VacJ family lipoprotein [Pseudomonadales bacterium]
MKHKLFLAGLILSLFVPAQAENRNPDAWQGLNKFTFAVNDVADKVVLKPLATGYHKVTPRPVQNGVSNFFANLGEVNNGLNNLLQGKPAAALTDFLRLLLNSTVGIGGLFDPASSLGLGRNNESFGQTLSVWGVPQGPYLVLPLLGPSTLLDAVVMPLDTALDGLLQLHPVDHRNSLIGTRAVSDRAALLAAEKIIFGDRYIFLRDAYLQRRAYLVADGEVEDDFDEF